ncbi:MAG TPA: F0F1 ATP synthase subunit B [Nitriliruptorales bacterium]|nr:F0F1 ATP synthase subunit B [Nitriliruptorales bacterium]
MQVTSLVPTDTLFVAAEGGAGIEIILPAAAELFWGAVGFALFYLILQQFAFPKINQVLEERAASIQGRQEEARQTLEEAQSVRAKYQEQLKEAKSEANRILDEARQTAESMRRDIVAKAESEAEAIVQRAQEEVQAERERAVQQLRAEVGRLSVRLAEKIVQKELDQETHQALVDRYIQNLSGRNGNGQARDAEAESGAVATHAPPRTARDAPDGAMGGRPRTPADGEER